MLCRVAATDRVIDYIHNAVDAAQCNLDASICIPKVEMRLADWLLRCLACTKLDLCTIAGTTYVVPYRRVDYGHATAA